MTFKERNIDTITKEAVVHARSLAIAKKNLKRFLAFSYDWRPVEGTSFSYTDNSEEHYCIVLSNKIFVLRINLLA